MLTLPRHAPIPTPLLAAAVCAHAWGSLPGRVAGAVLARLRAGARAALGTRSGLAAVPGLRRFGERYVRSLADRTERARRHRATVPGCVCAPECGGYGSPGCAWARRVAELAKEGSETNGE